MGKHIRRSSKQSSGAVALCLGMALLCPSPASATGRSGLDAQDGIEASFGFQDLVYSLRRAVELHWLD